MSKFFSLAVLFFFIVLLLPGSGQAQIVTNGDFEGGFSNGVAIGWTSFVKSGHTATFSDGTEYKYNGTHSQKIVSSQGADHYSGIWQQVTVPEGERIRIDAWVYRSYGGDKDNFLNTIAVHRNGNTQWDAHDVFIAEFSTVLNTWNKASITVRSDTGTLTFWLRTQIKWNTGGNATAWFDAVTVTAIGPTPIPEFNPAPYNGWALFEELPYPKDSIIAGQFSTQDHTGGNADGCAYVPANSSEGVVLLDIKGPGAIVDMWETGLNPAHQIRVRFDDRQTPDVESPVLEFFDGQSCRWVNQGQMPWTQYQVYPYTAPLNRGFDDAGGGNVSTILFPHQERATVTRQNKQCYAITSYHKYEPNKEVVTWDVDTWGPEMEFQRMVFEDPSIDPKDTSGNQLISGTLSLSNGQTGTMASINDSGYIAAIKIDPSPANRAQLMDAWIEITFDSRAPSVLAPIGYFFGCPYAERNVNAMGIGMSTNGDYYCYFPMPFWQSATIKIINSSGASMSIPYKVYWNDTPYESHAGYFSARIHDGNDIHIKGSGTYLGEVCTINGNVSYNSSYLEADERITVDGNFWVTHLGTGTEDFFHGGWYFETGEFSNATHGCPYINPNENNRELHALYRLRPLDFIPFRRSFHLNLEPYQPDVQVRWCVFTYERPSLGMVQTDFLNITDSGSESSHNYSISGQTWSGSFISRFEGVTQGTEYTHGGRKFNGYSQFTVAIDPKNDGVMLRRLYDHHDAGQEANVYVDNSLVGIWYNFDENKVLRWKEDSFMIPRAYTDGKSSITIKIDSIGSVAWSEFYYEVFSRYLLVTGDVHVEAEDRGGTQSSGPSFYSENISANGQRWSGGRHLRLASSANGNWVQFPFSVPSTGHYFVSVGITRGSGYGRCQTSIDGSNIGSEINMAGSTTFREVIRMDPVYLASGSHTIRFTVTNSGTLGIDCVELNRIRTTPLPTETPWIPAGGTPRPTNTVTNTPTITNTPTNTPTSSGLLNGNMEGGFTNGTANQWTQYVTNGNPTFSDGTDYYHGGAHSQKIVYPQPSGNGYAGLYQNVACSPSQSATLTGWKRDITSGGDYDIVCRLGYDLSGGTNPQSGNVVWNEFNCTPHSTWISKSVNFNTTGNSVTVFIEVWHKGWGGTHTAWLDDVTLEGIGGPAATPTNTPTNTRTNTPTNTRTNTPTNTRTNTRTNTPTRTPTNTRTNTPTNTPTGALVSENFESMPTWSSSYDAGWGSAATWSIVAGGQSGNCLRAVRSSGGSSAKVRVYSVPTSTNITISIYMRCPSMSNYWMETAYKLGSNTAENFDQDAGSWTLIKKFDSYGGQNGNGDSWTQYSGSVNTGGNNQISIGYKLGSSGNGTSNVHWDTLRIQ